ncbi:hypothetical protein ONA70_30365 [Micromonospora yasonensis]|uniref:hypothetical protein n=1 Tax=Micromonospora yasonensis TaxID=1128667 RepID=UPI00223210FD|nr:hypothetical protein [Micromonospora yasonensis]MCW3844400.1 hypothetical protein [Micromonospora yasonensis]
MTGVVAAVAAGGLVTDHPGATPPMTYNVLLRVPGSLGTPTVVRGTLQNTVGGRRTAAQRPTLSLFLCPGATLRGIAYWLLRKAKPSGAPDPTPYDEMRVATALWAWNRDYLAALGGPAGWRTGLWLPLPVEVDAGGAQWVTDWETVGGWADQLPSPLGAALDTPAQHLPLPEPAVLSTEVAAWLSGRDLDDVADVVARDLVGNPFEAVFRILEILRQVAADDAGDAVDLAAAVTNGLATWELSTLASVTAGHGVLRRLWSLVGPSSDGDAEDARDLLGPALGLTRTGSGVWQPPDVLGPTVIPDELTALPPAPPVKGRKPAPQGLVTPWKVAAENPGGRHSMMLGRDLCIGVTDSYTQKNGTSWTGPAYVGRLDPAQFIQDNAAAIGFTTDAERARLRVVELIAPNEGRLDAARGADKGTLSTGIQQWSAHLNEELPVLLARFKRVAPDHYDLFFGMYGLQPEPWWRVDGKEAAAEVADPAAVRAANPEAFDAAGAAKQGKEYALRYATLFQVRPGGGRVRLAEPPDSVVEVLPRHAFFGVTKQGKAYTVAPEWCARIRLASLCSLPYNLVQVWTAVWRFERLARQPLGKATLIVRGRPYRIRDFSVSEYGAALMIDQHINAPFWVTAAIDRAIDRTERAIARMPEPVRTELRPFDEGTSGPLRAQWLRLFQINYLAERDLVGKADRDMRITGLHDRFDKDHNWTGLDPEPGSFAGWVGP